MLNENPVYVGYRLELELDQAGDQDLAQGAQVGLNVTALIHAPGRWAPCVYPDTTVVFMAGHSKWATQHRKNAQDARRQNFSPS